MHPQISPEGKTGKEIPEPSRSELLPKYLGKNFALPESEDNTSGLLNRGTASPLLRTPPAICQKSQELSFWEMMDSSTPLSTCAVCTTHQWDLNSGPSNSTVSFFFSCIDKVYKFLVNICEHMILKLSFTLTIFFFFFL